jgi:hypothetical protein
LKETTDFDQKVWLKYLENNFESLVKENTGENNDENVANKSEQEFIRQ